ncbi:hypothetical protein K440DRAFT_637771 [Wilcoxina mikolae CBS 423.85]|nr:hypothetical protein K440DRAFT_637771 [Wilcoxina mikolae CBS 423.85]
MILKVVYTELMEMLMRVLPRRKQLEDRRRADKADVETRISEIQTDHPGKPMFNWSTKLRIPSSLQKLFEIHAPTHDPKVCITLPNTKAPTETPQGHPPKSSNQSQDAPEHAVNDSGGQPHILETPGLAPEVQEDPDSISEIRPAATSTAHPTSIDVIDVDSSSWRPVPELMPHQSHPLAAEFYNHITPNLDRMVQKYFSGQERVTFNLILSPAISGQPNESNAKPIVLVTCRSTGKMRKAIDNTGCIDRRKFDVRIQKGGLTYPSDLIGRPTDKPRQQPNDSSGLTTHVQLNIYQCGIRICPLLDDNPVGATLVGGFVEVGGRCCGLTVCHVFTDGLHVVPGESAPSLYDNTESDHETGSLNSVQTISVNHHTAGERADTDPEEITGSMRWRLGAIGGSENPGVPSDPGNSARIAPSSPTNNPGSPKRPLIIAASGIRLSRLPNSSFSSGAGSFPRYVMDWALIDMGDEPKAHMPNSYTSTQVTKTTLPGRKEIYLLVDGKVYCKGTTSGVPSLVSLQDKAGMGLAFMVSTDRVLERGMSGAWLVDSATSDLIGHLYAISTSSPWGYFIPIRETFEDIKATIHEDNVGLPQSLGEARGVGNTSFLSRHHREILDDITPVIPTITGEMARKRIYQPVGVPSQLGYWTPVVSNDRSGRHRYVLPAVSTIHPDVGTTDSRTRQKKYRWYSHPVYVESAKSIITFFTDIELFIKLPFEIIAGVSTAAAGARITGNPIGRHLLLLGVLGGIIRTVVLIILPYLLFQIVTVAISSVAPFEAPLQPLYYGALTAGGGAIVGSIYSWIFLVWLVDTEHPRYTWIKCGILDFGGGAGEAFVGFLFAYGAKRWGRFPKCDLLVTVRYSVAYKVVILVNMPGPVQLGKTRYECTTPTGGWPRDNLTSTATRHIYTYLLPDGDVLFSLNVVNFQGLRDWAMKF